MRLFRIQRPRPNNKEGRLREAAEAGMKGNQGMGVRIVHKVRQMLIVKEKLQVVRKVRISVRLKDGRYGNEGCWDFFQYKQFQMVTTS